MGYYTFHTLTVYNTSDEVIDSADYEAEICEQFDEADFEEETKWYNSDSDMREFSKKYPELVFEIHAEGEESPDITNYYYKNGLCQECPAVITFDKYDENKLK